MTPSKKNTPKNQHEFIDYRLNETDNKIDNANRKLERIEDKLNDTFATRDYVRDYVDEKHETLDEKHKVLGERLGSLESDRTWLIRTVIGFVILGMLAAAVTFR